MAAINRSLQREFRDEAEEVEGIVAESELRARTMSDVALEARNRGDILSIGTERRVFKGRLLYAAGDFITVEGEGFQADINLAAVAYVRVVARGANRGGEAGSSGPGTFEMRLLERKSPVDRVEIGYQMIEATLLGRIVTVGQDHIIVLSDQREEWTVPLTAISWVVRRRRSR